MNLLLFANYKVTIFISHFWRDSFEMDPAVKPRDDRHPDLLSTYELLAHIERYHKGWLELVYLPPYSPELNPSELIWAHLKSHGLNRILTKTKEKFLEAVNNHLTKFSNDLSLGKSVFGKKELAFITEQMPHLLAA